jgi:NADPH2:quinone reductase
MNKMRAVVVDPNVTGRLTISEVDAPVPTPSQALIKVAAISLNRGEVRRSTTAEAGWQPGWDLAGTVEVAAADGSSPLSGTRVVGFVKEGAWAELVAVPTNSLAELPSSVSFAQAATLPVAGLTAMLKTGAGAIVNMASMGGAVIGTSSFSAYQAAKSGVVGLTRSAAIEYASQKIRINAVSPGLISTDILAGLPEEVFEEMTATIPLKRLGEAEEVAEAVVWLCSNAASYITGQNLVIDGGYTVQ